MPSASRQHLLVSTPLLCVLAVAGGLLPVGCLEALEPKHVAYGSGEVCPRVPPAQVYILIQFSSRALERMHQWL